ncbi:GNAT family N-acetyltransferase [Ascidiimonas sp. W6]|uniref:GNAT family N-acetyltransferase n=1 Tax=Ascidiimonas meishanensis TaxID=3128903 RepID=UPI0030EC21D8
MQKTPSVCYKCVSIADEIQQILDLQNENHFSSVSSKDKEEEGFLTVRHDYRLLDDMNKSCPHIIAVTKEKVIGYALSMLPSFGNQIPILQPMFNQLTSLLPDYKMEVADFVIMGQICIAKEYRKQGVFRGLYNRMIEELNGNYLGLITEVNMKNTRSLNAHYAVGFKTLLKHHANGQDWNLIWMRF